MIVMLIGVDNDHVPDDDNVNGHLASKDRATSKGVEELPGTRHLDNNQPDLNVIHILKRFRGG